MRFDFNGERVLAVVAHPDDADLLCSGTLARAKDDGAAIAIYVLCRGDKGQPSEAIDDLATVRRKEMRNAAELLRAELYFGDCPDGELMDGAEQRRGAIEIYRQFRPTLILAHPAEDYHPDHRAAGTIGEAASWFSASTGHVTASPSLDSPPSLWWMDTVNMADFRPGFFVDISPYEELKRQMLSCHLSQAKRATDENFTSIVGQMFEQCHIRGTQAGVNAAEAFRIHPAWMRAGAW